MGMLVDGKWTDEDVRTISKDGAFQRPESSFRDRITADGSSGFKAEPGRYHLFVAHNCPWAHRSVMFRKLKKLESVIGMSVSDRPKLHGWAYSTGLDEMKPGPGGVFYLYQVYQAADPGCTSRVTVPTLWDRQKKTIVNNESSEIIRMIGENARQLGGVESNFYPQSAAAEIDEVNDTVYMVNNGVYRTGFARSQEAYDEAAARLFGALDTLEARLDNSTYLVGDAITESDWRLFTTAIRFDPVYFVHFKCSKKRYADFPNLSRHLEALRTYPGVMDTVRMDHIRYHYFRSHLRINPNGLIPIGPVMDWEDEA